MIQPNTYIYVRLHLLRYYYFIPLYHSESLPLIQTEPFEPLTSNDGGANGEKMHASGTGALTHEGDIVGVASEERDMLLYPVQGGDLVHEAIIRNPRLRLRRHVGVQEAEYAQPVVHSDDHLVGVAR